MKILITTDLYTTSTNGVVTSVKNLYQELIKKGHDVRILTLSETAHSYQKDNVYFIRSMPFGVYPDIRMPLSYRHRLIKELIDWSPDVIHSQCEFFTYFFAARIAKKTKAPIVHTYHTMYEQYVTYVIPFKRLGVKMVRKFVRWRLKNAECVIAPTEKVKESLSGYHIKPNVCVIPSGINLDQHKQRIDADKRVAMRRDLGFDNSHFVLLNLGRLGSEKNLEELIKLYPKAYEQNKKLRLLIVGGGPAKNDLEKLAKDLGVSDRVIFTGMVKPTDVHKYYQLGDLFVSASTSETQGLTYVEACANRLPLLCRQDDCLKDVIRTGENGYVYCNEEEFLSLLKKITDDPAWCTYATVQSELTSKKFDKSHFGDAVEKEYLAALKKGSVDAESKDLAFQ